jgi:hypothetical protein
MESSYLGNIPAYGIFRRQFIIGDGSTTTFSLDYGAATSTQVLVSLDGVIQEPEYSYSVNSVAGQGYIVFTEPIDLNSRIFIIYLGQELLVSPLSAFVYTTTTHTGDGSTTVFTIESGHDVNSVLVFYNGICMVPTTDYTIATNQLTFTFAPVNGSNIMMRYLPV